jgi:hypothetical protein
MSARSDDAANLFRSSSRSLRRSHGEGAVKRAVPDFPVASTLDAAPKLLRDRLAHGRGALLVNAIV